MQNEELIEFEWDERSQLSTFTYENQKGQISQKARVQPFNPPKISLESYWGELIWFVKSQVQAV